MKTFLHIYCIVGILLFGAVFTAYAQESDLSGVKIENQTAMEEDNVTSIYMDIVLDA